MHKSSDARGAGAGHHVRHHAARAPSSAKPAKWLQKFPALARSITHAETSHRPPARRYGRPRNWREPAPLPDRSGRSAPYFANHARCLSCAAIHDNRTSVAGGRDCGRRKPPSLNHSIGMGWRRQERRVVVWRPDSRQIKVHHNGTYRFGSFLAWSDSKVVAVTNAEGDVRSELSSLRSIPTTLRDRRIRVRRLVGVAA